MHIKSSFSFQIHKKEKSFKCHICGLSFRHKHSQVRHLVQHSADRPFRCQAPKCEASFASAQRLREHTKKRHPFFTILGNSGGSNNRPILPANLAGSATNKDLKYQPIAPAPIKNWIPQTLQAPLLQPQVIQTQQPLTYLTSNGNVFLITQPSPQNLFQPLILNNSPFIFPSGSLAPITSLQATQAPPLLIQAPAVSPSIVPSIVSPASSNNNNIGLPNLLTKSDTAFSVEMTKNVEKVTLKNSKGEKMKYDILERAMLELPELGEDSKAS